MSFENGDRPALHKARLIASIAALFGRYSSEESEPRSVYPREHDQSRHQRDSREWELFLRQSDSRECEQFLHRCDSYEWERSWRGREPDWLDPSLHRFPTLPSLLSCSSRFLLWRLPLASNSKSLTNLCNCSTS